jgi:quinol monooxygenase YgiN
MAALSQIPADVFLSAITWATELEYDQISFGGAPMIKVIYSYEVPSEKQDEYLKITKDEIKPFWESHGCEAYTVWLSLEGSTRFMKEMVFKDELAMQSAMKLAEAEPIKKLFFQFAGGITRITYRQVV